jgi:hypothetical protein
MSQHSQRNGNERPQSASAAARCTKARARVHELSAAAGLVAHTAQLAAVAGGYEQQLAALTNGLRLGTMLTNSAVILATKGERGGGRAGAKHGVPKQPKPRAERQPAAPRGAPVEPRRAPPPLDEEPLSDDGGEPAAGAGGDGLLLLRGAKRARE